MEPPMAKYEDWTEFPVKKLKVMEMDDLISMIADIRIKAKSSRISSNSKETCKELANDVANLDDAFHVVRSSKPVFFDLGVQRALAALKMALQKSSSFIESCGKASRKALNSKGLATAGELEMEVQKGALFLSLALNTYNVKKTIEIQSEWMAIQSEWMAIQSNVLDFHRAKPASKETFSESTTGESPEKPVNKPNPGVSSQETMEGHDSGNSAKILIAENPSASSKSQSLQKKIADPSDEPGGNSSIMVNERSRTPVDSSHQDVTGPFCDRSQTSESVVAEPSSTFGEISQTGFPGPSLAVSKNSQSALAGLSSVLLKKLKGKSGMQPLILGSPPDLPTSLSNSNSHAHCIPATNFSICWGDNKRYWVKTVCNGSKSDEVYYLSAVCWLDMTARLDTSILKSGTYVVTWRYKVTCMDDCWEHTPVMFKMSEIVDDKAQDLHKKLVYLCPKAAARYNEDVTFTVCTNPEDPVILCSKDASSKSEGIWIEYPVFHFTIEEGKTQLLDFAMIQHSGYWKQGLALDTLFITPQL